MPRLDLELTKQGLIPFLPSAVQEAASRRAPEFFGAFMSTAVLSKGAFYLTKERFEELKEQFPPATAPQPTRGVSAGTPELSEFDLAVVTFLDLEKDTPHPEWAPAREAYREEITEAEAEKCTPCKINSIKNKYKNILSQIPYGK